MNTPSLSVRLALLAARMRTLGEPEDAATAEEAINELDTLRNKVAAAEAFDRYHERLNKKRVSP